VDGIRDPSATGGTPENPLQLCVGTATSSFLNLHADSPEFPASFDMDVEPFACTHAALPAVSFAGL